MLLTKRFSLVRSASLSDQYYRMFNGPDAYTSVGHASADLGPGELKPVIWMYDGQIQKQIVDFEKGKTSHIDTWGVIYGKHYYGRYEPRTGRLTVVKPERMRMREIPEVLLQELYRSFPEITEIKEY